MARFSALIKFVLIVLVVGLFMQLGDEGKVSWAGIDQEVERQTVPTRTPVPPPPPTNTPAPPPPPTNTPAPPPPATNTPALSPTATGTPMSPTPSTTPVATTRAPTVTIATDTSVYSGPGLDYAIVGSLAAGDTAPVVGRNADSSWWQILFQRGEAWIPDSAVTTSPRANTVPVVSVSPPETTDAEPSTLPSTGGGSWLFVGGAILVASGALVLLAGRQTQRRQR